MRAHRIHDDAGRIRSVVFQATEMEGDLEIEPSQEGERVTAVDLSEIFPETPSTLVLTVGPPGIAFICCLAKSVIDFESIKSAKHWRGSNLEKNRQAEVSVTVCLA
jgi:hypothetical protein